VTGRGLQILLALCLAAGAARAAEAPFIGTWTLDPARTRLPDVMTVQSQGGGKYVFELGAGPEAIVADGSPQPGYGKTLLSVKPLTPDTWVVERRQDGRLLLRATWKLSADGQTLNDYFRGFNPDGSMLSMDYVYRRTGDGTGFAAVWRSVRETLNAPFVLQVTAYQSDGLSFDNPFEQITRNLRFDGRDYPREGANAGPGASASVRRLDARRLMITDKRNGKVTDTQEVGLSADLKTLTITQRIVGADQPNVFVFRRT
jgi:hypothetical protein